MATSGQVASVRVSAASRTESHVGAVVYVARRVGVLILDHGVIAPDEGHSSLVGGASTSARTCAPCREFVTRSDSLLGILCHSSIE